MYHLAQVNASRMIAPLTDPLMSGFATGIDEINALADCHSGFIWRLEEDVFPFEDSLILINISVWASLQDLSSYVYAGDHAQFLKRRRQWFKRFDGPHMALWWIPQGHIPSVEEAKERLAHLRTHGETLRAFSFKRPFPVPSKATQPLPALEECPV